ncbi:MAG: twin-arginine translocation signal domain-containing protein, partial [Lachnospiraceae bacterium]|nr:twin-arginine translocation signal domain-containing protein [Lachnospiraceae bacterium]
MKEITRRDFLRGSAAGVASLCLSSSICGLAAEDTQSSGISLDVSDYMDQWIYIDEAVMTNQGSVVLDDDGNPKTQAVTPCYALQGLVYCSNPADASVQVMDIYVPAVYMDAVDNGDDTYTCTVNTEAVFTNGDVTYT